MALPVVVGGVVGALAALGVSTATATVVGRMAERAAIFALKIAMFALVHTTLMVIVLSFLTPWLTEIINKTPSADDGAVRIFEFMQASSAMIPWADFGLALYYVVMLRFSIFAWHIAIYIVDVTLWIIHWAFNT